MTDNRTTELESLSKLKMAGRLRYWRGTIEIPEIELHAICDEIQAEHEQAIAAMLGSEKCEPIVRCKDCKYFDNSVCYRPDGDGDYARWAVEPNGFCAWSARRWSDE